MTILRAVSFCVISALGAAGAAAGQSSPSWDVEVEVGQFFFDAETSSEARDALYGASARRWLSERWAAGLAVRSLDVEAGPGESLDVWLVDLVATRRLLDGERLDLDLFGGPGLFRSEFEESPQRETSNDLTLHLGLGAELPLGRRAFLRPQARARWLDDLPEAVHAEVGLALGIRLGS